MIRRSEIVSLFLGGHEILVEYRDLKWFGEHKFYVRQGAGQSKYVITNVKGENKTRALHLFIMEPPKGLEVDHINGNGLDNRRSNLRIVTHQINQNNLPKRATASSKYYGVSKADGNRRGWLAAINYGEIRKNLGRFPTQEAAANSYNNAVIKLGLVGIKRMNEIP